jgi:hypothetical protein
MMQHGCSSTGTSTGDFIEGARLEGTLTTHGHGQHHHHGVLDPAVTPLPGALPLLATGLGALALLSLRRKRKSAAASPAAFCLMGWRSGFFGAGPPDPSKATALVSAQDFRWCDIEVAARVFYLTAWRSKEGLIERPYPLRP